LEEIDTLRMLKTTTASGLSTGTFHRSDSALETIVQQPLNAGNPAQREPEKQFALRQLHAVSDSRHRIAS